MKRFVVTHPAAIGAAAAATAALVQMLWLHFHDHAGVFDAGVITAWIAAVGALGIRQVVTPVASPRDNAGNQLVPAAVPAPTPGNVPPMGTNPAAGQVQKKAGT